MGFDTGIRIEIDNNLVENAIRPTALGKKNWLFIGDADAGQRSAINYTVIENCRRRSLDPFGYLRAVLTRLPNMTNHQIPEVTPQAWARAQLQVKGSVLEFIKLFIIFCQSLEFSANLLQPAFWRMRHLADSLRHPAVMAHPQALAHPAQGHRRRLT